ncbi:MAG TPA: hypothetical protein VF599_17850 [Pyrinomonadaceae bacterium]|jgi:hypothetical protein
MGLELEKETASGAWSGVYDVVNVAQQDLQMESYDLQQISAAPIRIWEMDNGVDFMVDALIKCVKDSGTIDLLRVHGHGVAGVQTVSCGMSLPKSGLPYLRSIISSYNFVHIQKCLARLQGLFAPNGQVWLMGCEVGATLQGTILLTGLAKLWQVPVKAGFLEQLGGSVETFKLEGMKKVARP